MDRETLREQTSVCKEVVNIIQEESLWERQSHIAEAESEISAVAAAETDRGELFFAHPETGARLTLVFPAYETGDAAKALLDNPLDAQMQYSDEGFIGTLGESHRAIASSHATQYIEPVADPTLIARLYVPVEYDDTTLRDSFIALERIANDSESLHEELFECLDDRL